MNIQIAMVFVALFSIAQAKKPANRAPGKVIVTGAGSKALISFDRMMETFVAEHQIPGAALAVARHGKLVYSRGFTWASAEDEPKVLPRSLFRIASVTKPITALAVLKLVDHGKLRLDDSVFKFLDLREKDAPIKLKDERIKTITIRELLQHRGGWDRDKSFDPMFAAFRIAKHYGIGPPPDQNTIIRYMFETQPLDNPPGSKFAYSNFGYCVLGRAIEKASGKRYEEYVREEVLKPLGIVDMRIGGTLPARRAKGEVRYFDKSEPVPGVVGETLGKLVPDPYGGFSLETLDSHGGWIASAPDLVRFASSFERPARLGIRNKKLIEEMFTPPGNTPQKRFYGFGWEVVEVDAGRTFNFFHNGSLPGTSTVLVHRFDGLTWAVLFNTRDVPGSKDEPAGLIDPLVHQAADLVKIWPD